MAGPFAHMLVCQSAGEPGYIPPDLLQLLDKHQCFMLLGAEAPDLPAIWDNVDTDGWSERFHSGPRTNSVVIAAFNDLRSQSVADGRLAWLFGYVGHIIVDVVVHPVVHLAMQKRSGTTVHRECEMTEDSLLFKQLKSYDLKSQNFLDWLEEVTSARNRATFDQTMRLWASKLEQCY